MGLILNLIYWFLNIFLFALIARLILDYVRMFKPDWRPKGAVLAAAELDIFSGLVPQPAKLPAAKVPNANPKVSKHFNQLFNRQKDFIEE